MHVRSAIYRAFKTAIGSVPVVSTVYDARAVVSPVTPASGAAYVEIAFGPEGAGDGNSVALKNPHPRDYVLDRKVIIAANIVCADRDFTPEKFEDDVLAPIEAAIANSEDLAQVSTGWMIHSIDPEPQQDGKASTYSAVVAWEVSYSTQAGVPGVAL